jgi:glycosyltransferase involved in cell wall biosynthesis
LNILYITQWYSSAGGGGEVVFYNLANGMVKRGHSVDVICAKTINLGEHRDKLIAIHEIDPVLETLPPSLTQNACYILNAIRRGFDVIKKKNIEVIHANNLASVIAGSILSKVARKPLIVTIHDIFTTSSPEHWKNWVAQDSKISRITPTIAPLIEKITVRAPSSVIHTVSSTSKDDLIKFGARPGKIRIIPNGLDLKSYCRRSTSQIEYHDFFLFIGRLVFYKNLDVVISAFTDVARNVPSAKLVVVGEGPMLTKWKKRVSELGLINNVIFTGHVSEDKKIQLLTKCRALVLPSFVEGFGLVILESFAMEKPVLVANIRPLSEIVSDGIDGFLLPLDDPIGWSEKMSYLIANNKICMLMGMNGRKKLVEKYDNTCILGEMESLYLSLL